MTEETAHGTLVAKRDGLYTVYVFRLDDGKLQMCTKLPNWGPYDITIGQKGFLTTQFFEAGEMFYDRNTDTERKVQYTNVYFKEFVPDNKEQTTSLTL